MILNEKIFFNRRLISKIIHIKRQQKVLNLQSDIDLLDSTWFDGLAVYYKFPDFSINISLSIVKKIIISSLLHYFIVVYKIIFFTSTLKMLSFFMYSELYFYILIYWVRIS